MKASKEAKREVARKILIKRGVHFDSFNNDLQWKIGTVNFFPSTHNWFDEYTRTSGNGINELLKHISTEQSVITESSVIDKKKLSVHDMVYIALKHKNGSLFDICEALHKEIYQ